jgi:hypothetical protein
METFIHCFYKYTADSKKVVHPKPQTMNYERQRDAGCRLKPSFAFSRTVVYHGIDNG